MNQAAPVGANRRGFRRWKGWLLGICLLPLLALALSNLCLTSPWGRDRIAAKLSQRIGLKARMGGASWSPWHGLTLRNIEVSQPAELRPAIADPLLSIASIRLTPVWRSFLRGRFELLAADIESPHLVVSVEMLSYLARQAPAVQASQPSLAAHPPSSEAPPQIAPTQPATSGEMAAGPPAPETPGAEGGKPPPAHQPKPPPGPPRPTKWVHLRHGSFRLVAAGSAVPLLEIDDLTTDLPVAGEAASSSLHLASLKAHGEPLLSGFAAPLRWQFPVLSLNPVETPIHGLKLLLAGKLAFLDGLPLQLEAQLPNQSPTPLALPGDGMAKAAQVAAFSRFRGLLLAPGTWQGEGFAEVSAITIQQGEHHTVFDRGSCAIVLRGNMLSCVDARLIGDDLSLLGNATLLADGRAAGVLRLIAAPDTTVGIVKRFFPHSDPAANLTPMSTPQRAGFDLEAFGTFKDLQFRLGQNGPIVPPP